MKLNHDFIAHSSNGDTVLVPLGTASFSGIVRGNATFREIVSLLKEDISEPEIVSALLQRFDAAEDVIARDVRKALDELRSVGALDE